MRFQDRILDGPQFEDPIPGFDDLEDEDEAYERVKADEIDNATPSKFGEMAGPLPPARHGSTEL